MKMRFGLAALAAAVVAANVASAQPQVIGIANFTEHPALQQAVDGFMEVVKASGLDVRFHHQHAESKRELIRPMLEQIQAEKPVLILTVSSPVTRRAIRLVDKSIPLVFTASTVDPVAANFVPSFDRGGERHTGATMMPDYNRTLAFVRQLLPDAKRIGTLFDPSDERDLLNVDDLIEAGEKLGLEIVPQAVVQRPDLAGRMADMRSRIDAMYLISSNLVQGSLPLVAQAAVDLKLPTVNMMYTPELRHQFVGSHTTSFRKGGERAGAIAVRILRGEKPADIPVSLPQDDDFVLYVSSKALAALGREVPAALKDCKCFVPE